MKPHIILRFVYATGEEDVPRIQYLSSDATMFPGWFNWIWKDFNNQAHLFDSLEEADIVRIELGDKHSMCVARDVAVPERKKKEVPSEIVYANTCKRLGEHE